MDILIVITPDITTEDPQEMHLYFKLSAINVARLSEHAYKLAKQQNEKIETSYPHSDKSL